MERRNVFYEFKTGELVYIRIDNGDGGMAIVVEETNLENGECFYQVFSMLENKTLILYPYELELVRG